MAINPKEVNLGVFDRQFSIFLYVLTPEGDIRRVPVNQVLGVSFFVVVFFVCNVSCVSSE